MGRRLSFLHPHEVRLWLRASGYTIDAMPVTEGDAPAIRDRGQEVGRLVLETSSDSRLEAVTRWHDDDTGPACTSDMYPQLDIISPSSPSTFEPGN